MLGVETDVESLILHCLTPRFAQYLHIVLWKIINVLIFKASRIKIFRLTCGSDLTGSSEKL